MGHVEQPENVIFWGAGATAQLGFRTTESQTKLLSLVTGSLEDEGKPLEDRVAKPSAKTWQRAGVPRLSS